ncbi:MAG: glycosyltransferase [Rhizobacter sp.]|nr:glycosyltransferase [Rhizobacter sp.]
MPATRTAIAIAIPVDGTRSTHRINVLEVVGNAIVGGMETCVLRLCEGLARDRFNVVVACPFDGRFADHLRTLGFEVAIVQMQDDPSWSSIQMLAALVKLHRIDVLHAHLSNAHMLAGLVGKLTHTPVVATIHGRAVPMLDLEVQRLADTHLSLVCQQTYRHAITLGIDDARLHTIPNGVPLDVFTPATSRTEGGAALRLELGIPAAAPLVGFVGRLSPEKGPDVFLRAMLGTCRAHPDAHFVMVGDGPRKAQCRQFIDQFQLAHCCHLAGLRNDMPAVYGELDIAVSTSHAEAMPLALMEAMACGLPVIATRVGGVPDLVQQGLTGWLVDDSDFEGVAWHLNNLLGDAASRRLLGDAARARAVQHFSLADSVAATAALFERLAAPRGELCMVPASIPQRRRTLDTA